MPELSNRQLKKLARLPNRISREVTRLLHSADSHAQASNNTVAMWRVLFSQAA